MDAFEEIVAAEYTQCEADALELMARIIERGNAALEGLPPEGEWQ